MSSGDRDRLKSLERRLRRWSIDQLRRRARRTAPPALLPPRPRILVLRHDRIGDAIVSTPVLTLLRERFPEATIDVLLGRKNAAVAPLLPAIDEALVLPSSLVRAVRFMRSLARRRYDLVINPLLDDSASGGLLTVWSGARVRIGFDGELGTIYDHAVPHPPDPVHIVRHTASVLSPLGVDPIGSEPRREAERLHLSHVANGPGSPCRDHTPLRIVLSLSARVSARQWPLERWSELATALMTEEFDVRIAAAPEDAEAQRNVCSRSGAVPLEVTSSFPAFVHALQASGLIVTPQTSTVHVASALRVPTVLLNTDDAREGQWTPWGVPSRVVSVGAEVSSIPIEDALSAVRALLREILPDATPGS